MSISYKVGGRFGNNLFQYFAAKVIGKYTDKNYIYNKNFEKVITDNTFEEEYNKQIEENAPNRTIQQDILLDGYFQTSFWINKEKEYIQSLLTINNEDRINQQYTIKDIVQELNKFIPYITDKDLVIHIRLDDFYHQGYNSEIIDPCFLKEYILELTSTCKFENIFFISDKIRHNWETKYMEILLEIPNSKLLNNTLLEDFCLIFYSKNIVLCRSTFGWISSLISPHINNIWFPEQTPLINSHQIIPKFNENSIHFKPTYMTSGASNY
jgi:hypothetical protein